MAVPDVAASKLPERPVLLAFFLFILIVGGASVAVRITYSEMAPFWVGAARFAVGAIVFWLLVYIRKLPLPRGRALLGAVIFGVLTVGLAFIFGAWGLLATPASLYQTLMAMIPLLTVFLSSMHGVEAITARSIFGSLLAIIGIGITVGGASNTQLSLPHIAAIFVSAIFMSEGGVLIKKFPPNPPIVTNAISMTVGTIILASASLISGERWALPTQTNTILAFIYLVFFVTVLAFMLYMFVLGEWTASGTSYGFVIIPLVTIAVATPVAGEQISTSFLIGAVFVIAGVFVGALLPSKTKPAAVEECKDRSGQVLPRCV